MPDSIVKFAPVQVKGLANLFLDWADERGICVSPMKLQKLLFFSHADFLVRYSSPLIKEGFEAWDYGPVNPSVYQSFKRFGDRPIVTRATIFDPVLAKAVKPNCDLPDAALTILRDRFDFYKQFSAVVLSDLSHSRAGPWRQARSLFANGLNADRKIHDELITSHHRLFDSSD